MDRIFEPVFLNESMVLNTAAYLFDGYSLKEEKTHESGKDGKLDASVGATLLGKLFSPISLNGEISGSSSKSSKSERIYTLGGLHMSVLKALKKGSKPQMQSLNLSHEKSKIQRCSFLSANVILKPVDFYEIIQLLSLLRPLLVKLFDQFGDQLIENRSSLSILNDVELKKYDKMIKSLLNSLESDYLKSRQLEMMMISPKTGKPIGVLDIPLGELDPVEMKSKMNDGQFHVVGKLIRYVEAKDTLSLVQRTSISQVVSLFEKLVSLSEEKDAVGDFRSSLQPVGSMVDKFVQLNMPGPAVRLLAMSVSA